MKIKPNIEIWKRINEAVLGENAAVVMSTMISGLCSILIWTNIVQDEDNARGYLAAMIISPEDRPVGSLLFELNLALEVLKKENGRIS